jgi:transposase
MGTHHYPSDLTDAQWALIEPQIPAARCGGRPRKTDMRDVVDAILYILRTGCQWRYLPGDLPPKSTVWWYFDGWRRDGTLDAIHDRLRRQVRTAEKPYHQRTTASVDSQSVDTTSGGEQRGRDNAKNVDGRKWHVVVDSMGNGLDSFSERDLNRNLPRFSERPKELRAALGWLVARKSVRPHEAANQAGRPGWKPSPTFDVNPRLAAMLEGRSAKTPLVGNGLGTETVKNVDSADPSEDHEWGCSTMNLLRSEPVENIITRPYAQPERRGGERSGRLRWVCPFHDDRNPSLYVDPGEWHYHCFGCGAHGDAIDFGRRLKPDLSHSNTVRFCLNKGQWRMSVYRGVLCRNCRPPVFPWLVIAKGDAMSAPFTEPGRSSPTALPRPSHWPLLRSWKVYLKYEHVI